MDALAQDLRFAMRQLVKAPAFTVTIVLTLALGIGATTAIFSLVEGILLRPLPFRDPDRLVLMGDHIGGNAGLGVTAREIATYRDTTKAFASMGGYTTTGFELSGGARPEEIDAARLTAGVFTTLGVQPLLGRVFTEQEDSAHTPLAVISYALWLNRFHRDPNILGKPMALDRKSYSIIGVMPRSFTFPLLAGQLNQTQLWIPMSLTPVELSDDNAGMWGFNLIGRLNDGVTVTQAAQDADRAAEQASRNFPANMAAIRITGDAALLKERAVGNVRPLLRTLFAAVAVVLLIACINVASLLLVRAIRRRREYAVRLALGAGSAALIRESFFEGLLLSLAGGLLGLGLAAAALRFALHWLPESMPRVGSVSMDAGVVGFALLISLITGALCSLAPAVAALGANLTECLKEGGRAGTGAQSHAWLRSALVVAEIAIAMVLLTVSGAFIRSFQKMRAVDPGFRADQVVVAGYQLPIQQYPTNSSAAAFDRDVLDRLSAKPGIVVVGMTNSLPASNGGGAAGYTIESVPVSRWKLQFASFALVDGDYFRAMDIRLIDGRLFTVNDRADSPLVVLVNETMAKHCWPGQNPIGKRIHAGNPKKGYPWATVVGIIADTKTGAPDQPNADQWYIPARQPATLNGLANADTVTRPTGGFIIVRAALDSAQTTQALRQAVAEVDPVLALDPVQPMAAVVSEVEAPRRFNTGLITAFALGALLLAITGIYAVVAFSVSLRTQEIAIRMALGAQRAGIARLVLTSGTKLAFVGCILGILGSVAVARLIASFLFGVSATDPLIYLASALIMIVMTLAASALPATRAASADPLDALRSN
ncbi:MAG: ABC transporter permease [Terracidiphilus sp.]|jgi:putative ABC transport system permease protein